ncbi:MAG: NosD domain-containing protein [Candidatus Bathyarchaeia archaeon]
MKQKTKLFAILATIIFSMILSPLTHLFPAVKATYVEGEITTDTVWTIVDSPFILSNNVTVRSGTTLTIEPEVEVKFGGKFSLIVNGKLVAVGNQEKPIKFTSNREKPEAGDWGTILINRTSQPSSLKYCLIEYGINGITLSSGSALIENALIANNSESGIHIEGNSQATIQNNIIKSNGDGITLTGNLTSSTITIKQNQITFNTHSGILLEAEAYGNTLIRNNTLSANQYGFYVSSNTSTLITRNYIFNNTVGIFYAQEEHEAHFNNICNNGLGMDVASGAVVNATYNYWGDKSGPYHESLNPYGKGNPVGGDGVNLDFIFFLTAPIDYHNNPPTSVLWTDKIIVAPNQAVTFIGTDSFDDGRVDQYFFDFGDGTNSGWTTLSILFHNYTSTGSYTARLKVMDDFGNISDFASTLINVVNLTPLEVTLSLSNYTVDYNEEVSVAVHVKSGGNPVENANVTLFSVKGGDFTPSFGLTNSSGVFVTKFKAPNVTEVTDVRIIARASMEGFADGSNHQYVKVLPPLKVHVTAEPQTVSSGEKATITVLVSGVFEKPVANAYIQLFLDYGNLSENAATTSQNGTASFEFTAPVTLTDMTATITVMATKTGYAGGYGECIIAIEPKKLVVEVYAQPSTVLSEEASEIRVQVSCNNAPVPDVAVTFSAINGGNFTETTLFTGSNGIATFTFIAPQVTVNTTVTIIANATKSDYVSGVGQTSINIMPKILSIQVIAERNAAISEEELGITVKVEYNNTPVDGANVTLLSDLGEVFMSAYTGSNGNVTFTFRMPPVPEKTNMTLTATAAKAGYAASNSTIVLVVEPGNLTMNVEVSPSTVESGKTAEIKVYVKCGEQSLANATVAITAAAGTLPITSSTTDENGYCVFSITAPETATTMGIAIRVNATKYGFTSAIAEATLTVVPVEGGWPLTTILLIAIPMLLAVVLVVLVKLKVISFSTGEEESS